MRPKNVNQIGSWIFKMLDLEGNEIVIPPGRSFNSLRELQVTVLQVMALFDQNSNNEYTKLQRELAAQEGVSWEEYVSSLIQHQMCVNNKGSIPCWNDGAGDAMHQAAGMIDQVVMVMPESVKKTLQKGIQAITPSRSKSLSGCAACGGTSAFDPETNNKGRAGTVNRVLNKVFKRR